MSQYVVYMDGSFQKGRINKSGHGIYIVDEKFNDTKIAIGEMDNRIASSMASEIKTLRLFLEFRKKTPKLHNARFVFYCDCELLVKFLNEAMNDPLARKRLNAGFKGFDTLNIEAAYWTKSHKKELGNLVVDTLAYNAMKYSDNSSKKYYSVKANTNIYDFFETPFRFPRMLQSQSEDNDELNTVCFNRQFIIESNFSSKAESSHNLDKVRLIEEDDHFYANIGGNGELLDINGHKLPKLSLEDILKEVFCDVSILREMNRYKDKGLMVTIQDKSIYDGFSKRLVSASKLILHRSDETLDKDCVRTETIEFMKDKLNRYAFIIQSSDSLFIKRNVSKKKRTMIM